MKENPSSANAPELQSLADRVRTARRKAAISQTEMARRIGVSASAVAQWEHPHGTQPSLQSIIRILEITGVSPDWLVMGRTGSPTKVRSTDGEVPAISFEIYAHSLQEENLLTAFRQIPTRKRSLLVSLVEEFADPGSALVRKSRLKR